MSSVVFCTKHLTCVTILLEISNVAIFTFLCSLNLLISRGKSFDIEKNCDPKSSSLTFCHWKLNGLTVHDFIQIQLLQTYITQRNYGPIYLSKRF